MRRAAPAILLSAAGLTWLLNHQGVIDARAGTGLPEADQGGTPLAAGTVPSASPTPSATWQAAPAPAAPTAAATTSASPTPAAPKTSDGPVVDTRFGPVQVRATLTGGRLVNVQALTYPSGGRSGRINQRALPVLVQESVSAQSAQVDVVSGATYTSVAYMQSLQAALDAVG